jgi:hypothetical protein
MAGKARPTLVTVPAPGLEKDKLPAPSVVSTCPARPTVAGSFRLTSAACEVAGNKFVAYVPPAMRNPCGPDTTRPVNTGDILLPAIAAAAFMSPSTIIPGVMVVTIPVLVMSPVRLPVIVEALPIRLAVIVPAEKLPDASRATMVELPAAEVAVVALLDTLPAVEIVASCVSRIPAVGDISAVVIGRLRRKLAAPVLIVRVRLDVLLESTVR